MHGRGIVISCLAKLLQKEPAQVRPIVRLEVENDDGLRFLGDAPMTVDAPR